MAPIFAIINLDLLDPLNSSHCCFMTNIAPSYVILIKSCHTPRTATAKLSAMGVHSKIFGKTVICAPFVSRKLRAHAGRVNLTDFVIDCKVDVQPHNCIIFDQDTEVWAPQCHSNMVTLRQPLTGSEDLGLASQFLLRIAARATLSRAGTMDVRSYLKTEAMNAEKWFQVQVLSTPPVAVEAHHAAAVHPHHVRDLSQHSRSMSRLATAIGSSRTVMQTTTMPPPAYNAELTEDRVAQVKVMEKVYTDSTIRRWSVESFRESLESRGNPTAAAAPASQIASVVPHGTAVYRSISCKDVAARSVGMTTARVSPSTAGAAVVVSSPASAGGVGAKGSPTTGAGGASAMMNSTPSSSQGSPAATTPSGASSSVRNSAEGVVTSKKQSHLPRLEIDVSAINNSYRMPVRAV
jgi:hypothetical protein